MSYFNVLALYFTRYMVGRGVGTVLSTGMWLVGVLVLYFSRYMVGRGVGTVLSQV